MLWVNVIGWILRCVGIGAEISNNSFLFGIPLRLYYLCGLKPKTTQMSHISFQTMQVAMPRFHQEALAEWIERVAEAHDRVVGTLTYVFCSDDYILDVNRQYLHHDYYTDIITFDYSTRRRLSGDMVISLDTVASNAALFGRDYDEELLRVVIHGVLHLCGINDKGPGERELMEQHENAALAMIDRPLIQTDD